MGFVQARGSVPIFGLLWPLVEEKIKRVASMCTLVLADVLGKGRFYIENGGLDVGYL